MVTEMVKLRDKLTELGIDWNDKSTKSELYKIDRTHFYYNGYHWSAINGFGTYGGLDVITNVNKGFIELMSNAINNGEPVGYLRADDVINYLHEVDQVKSEEMEDGSN